MTQFVYINEGTNKCNIKYGAQFVLTVYSVYWCAVQDVMTDLFGNL